MSSCPLDSFELFPQLHTEIRLQIWEYHFSVARIHVLHPVAPRFREPSKILLNCTTLDAVTSQIVPSQLRSDINHEAYAVAAKVCPRQRIYNLTDPVSLVSLYGGNRIRGDLPARSLDEEQGVDVSWEHDLIYVCSPESYLPFMGFYKQQWPQKIQHLAVSVPYYLSRNRFQSWRSEQRTPSFDGDLLPAAVKAIPNLKTLRVALLVNETPVEVDEIEERSEQEPARDDFGFITLEGYLNKNGDVGKLTSLTDHVRVYNILGTKLNETYPGNAIALEQCVDVDLRQASDGEYSRRTWSKEE